MAVMNNFLGNLLLIGVSFGLIAIVGHVLTLIKNEATVLKKYPVSTESCILVTDAAQGPAREAALHLADHGIHVLAGVKNEYEQRSFMFDSRKGLEPIVFDISGTCL